LKSIRSGGRDVNDHEREIFALIITAFVVTLHREIWRQKRREVLSLIMLRPNVSSDSDGVGADISAVEWSSKSVPFIHFFLIDHQLWLFQFLTTS